MTITTGDADSAPGSAGGPMLIIVIGTGHLDTDHAAYLAEIGPDVHEDTSVAA